MIKTRFCPSPTGQMHLGNVRTALFNALLARSQQGSFLLRIEDTDQARSEEAHTEVLLEDLRWMGLPWQEGPEVNGPAGPYWQSQRQAIYDDYYHRLEVSGAAYPCFCTEQQLAIHRKIQLAQSQPPRYPGTCRHLTPEMVAEKLQQGLRPTLRFHVPSNRKIEFVDLVRGTQIFQGEDIGDFVIRRADGTASFLFCNALDDSLMGVTHALRGEDHLANTPRQLLILEALKLPAPHYGHISLIMGTDGSPLSKRHGSRSIKELRAEGYLAEGIMNYLARLGHHYERHDWMSLQELAENFSTDALGKTSARFDPAQLLFWQKEAIAHSANSDLWQWMGEKVHACVPKELVEDFIEVVKSNVVFPQDALLWAERFFADRLEYPETAISIMTQTGEPFFIALSEAIAKQGTDFKALAQQLQEVIGLKGKALYLPLRLALTGTADGPEMVRVTKLLGKARMQNRIQQLRQQLKFSDRDKIHA